MWTLCNLETCRAAFCTATAACTCKVLLWTLSSRCKKLFHLLVSSKTNSFNAAASFPGILVVCSITNTVAPLHQTVKKTLFISHNLHVHTLFLTFWLLHSNTSDLSRNFTLIGASCSSNSSSSRRRCWWGWFHPEQPEQWSAPQSSLNHTRWQKENKFNEYNVCIIFSNTRISSEITE